MSRWLSLEFSVLSYSTLRPFISIFGLCLTSCLLCNIQAFFFYWACPVDSGSRRRANRLEKRSLSRPRHISLHHSRSSERRKSFLAPLPLTPLPSCSLLILFSEHPPPFTHPFLTRVGSVTKLSVILTGVSDVLSLAFDPGSGLKLLSL